MNTLRFRAGRPHSPLAAGPLDDPNAKDVRGIYLTVSGLSAEHGDDGQVGRGNRVNETDYAVPTNVFRGCPGKNPVSHTGKIYNVLAKEMADAIAGQIKGIARASVLILPSGRLVSEPQVVATEVAVDQDFNVQTKADIEKVARAHLGRVHETSERLIRGEIAVF
jgi:S-adenosylmethionine synthetase